MLLSDEMAEQRLNDETNRLFQLAKSKLSKVQVVADLYWNALSRPPSEQELAYAMNLFAGSANPSYVLQDLAWALMNSKEFVFRN
jgi:hypothetical protein